MALIAKATLQDYRSDSVDAWKHNNPILPLDTIGHVQGSAKYKIGNGVTPWNDLHFINNEDDRYIPLSPTLFGFNGITYIESVGQYLQRGDIINLHFKIKAKVDKSQNIGDEDNTFVVDLGFDIPKFNNNMIKNILLGDCKVFGFGDDLNQDTMFRFVVDPYTTFLSVKTRAVTAHQEYIKTLALKDMVDEEITISGVLAYISFDDSDTGQGIELETFDDILLDTNGNALLTRDDNALYATTDELNDDTLDSDNDVLLDRDSNVLVTRSDDALYVMDPTDTEVEMLNGSDMYPAIVNVDVCEGTELIRDNSYIACCVYKNLCFLEFHIEFYTKDFDYNKHEWISIDDDEEDEDILVLVNEDGDVIFTGEEEVILVIDAGQSNPFVPTDDDFALHTLDDEVILDPVEEMALFIKETITDIFIPTENTTPITLSVPNNIPMPVGSENMLLGGDFHSIGMNSLYINHIHIDKPNRKIYFITENNRYDKTLNKLVYDDIAQETATISGSIIYRTE